VKVTVEGDCDERGTREYNLALGARRANAVKEYLVSLGVSSARVDTISYGKEHPICTESTEDCWAQNRRGVTSISGGANS
jgi:peptidoglycan-associated lipoprotein